MIGDQDIASVPRVRNIIVCEDVRRETNNKEIIIGVYSAGIKFNKTAPAKLRQLCFRVEFELNASAAFVFHLISPSGATVINFRTEITVERPGKGVLIIMDPDRSLYEEGIYEMRCGFDDQEPEIVDTMEVTFTKE